METIGAIVLAAGGSSRLGRPKQLLPFAGQSLVRRAAEAALAARASPVVVVVGAILEAVATELRDIPVRVVLNAGWAAGIGTSIRAGMAALMECAPAADAVILLVCDQPFVDAHVLRALIEAWRRSGASLAASQYADTLGVPALFARAWFPELAAIAADHGAKQILRTNATHAASIPFPLGACDIDTEADVAEFLH